LRVSRIRKLSFRETRSCIVAATSDALLSDSCQCNSQWLPSPVSRLSGLGRCQGQLIHRYEYSWTKKHTRRFHLEVESVWL